MPCWNAVRLEDESWLEIYAYSFALEKGRGESAAAAKGEAAEVLASTRSTGGRGFGCL